jgi:hypothetical protein
MTRRIFALALVMALVGGTSARAQPSLDFDVPLSTVGTSISYAGGAAPLVGSGIAVDFVTGSGTPLSDGVAAAIQGGTLSFTTGSSTGSDSNDWYFGAGPIGGLSITGGISSLGIAAGTTLLSGTISSASVQDVGNVFQVSVAVFFNTVNTTLANSYGLPGGSFPWGGTFALVSTGLTASPPSGFTVNRVDSGNVVTTVPEPSSLAIAGIGAAGLLGYGWRRRKTLGA